MNLPIGKVDLPKMIEFLKKYDLAIKLFFLMGLASLFLGLCFLYGKVNQLASIISDLKIEPRKIEESLVADKAGLPGAVFEQACPSGCMQEIEKILATALATISAVPSSTPIIQKETPISKQTVHIPLGGPGSTTSTDWQDVKNAEVWIDLKNEYGEDAKVSWNAFLKLAHSNGTAYARLYDVTHSIAVLASEISTQNSDYTHVSSGNLNFWAGRNLYRVQLKSLTSYEVSFSSGSIKISY